MDNIFNIGEEAEKYSKILGPELSFQFAQTRYELFVLRSTWRTYREFFGNHKERFDLFFEVSPTTAQTLERTLFETTLVQIRRLTDPPKTGSKNKNVTIQSFAEYLSENNRAELDVLVEEALEKADFAKDWVNRRIAHNDLRCKSGNKPLKPASRQKVDDAIDSIARPIKWIAQKKCNFTLVTHPIAALKGESWFVRHIYEGQIALKEKRSIAETLRKERKYKDASDLLDGYPEWLRMSEDIMDT